MMAGDYRFVLTCSVAGGEVSPFASFTWRKFDDLPMPTGRFEIGGSNGERLIILNPDASDGGEYFCDVDPGIGDPVRSGSGIVVFGELTFLTVSC